MQERPIPRSKFVTWFILFALGMILWALPFSILWNVGVFIVVFSGLLLASQKELARPVTKRNVSLICGALFAMGVLIVVSRRLPTIDAEESIVGFLHSPPVVGIFWVTTILLNYRRYELTQRTEKDASKADMATEEAV
jgi:hypothetical protein